MCFQTFTLSLLFFPLGEGDAQAAASLPQCYLSLLCWQPAAVGTNSKTIQCEVKAPGIGQAVLAGRAVRRHAAQSPDSAVRWTRT